MAARAEVGTLVNIRLFSSDSLNPYCLGFQFSTIFITFMLQTRPPTHLEGNLVFHRPTKLGIARSKRGFFVVRNLEFLS